MRATLKSSIMAMRHRSILTGFIVATTVIALAKERVEEEDERREIQ